VRRLLPRFVAHGIDAFVPHDLRRTGRTTLGRLGVSPLIGERLINHSKDVLEETYDLWDYFDEKRACWQQGEASVSDSSPCTARRGDTSERVRSSRDR
jgi:hypothetical protein